MTLNPTDLEAVQRHTVRVLIVSQAVGALGMTIGFATAAPRTWLVCTKPDCVSDPEMSRASRAAVAKPIVMPRAPTA